MLHYLRHMRSCACPPSGPGASYTAFPGACDAAYRAGAVGVDALLKLVLMVSFFSVVLLVVLVGLASCFNMSGAHFSSNALNVATSAILHGAVGTMAGRLFGRRAFVLVLLLTLSRVPCACAMDSFSSPNASIAHSSISGSGAAALAGGSLFGMPLSASPQRTDPRPPTCASVGRDIAQMIQQVSQGDAGVAQLIVSEARRHMVDEGDGDHWPVEEPDKPTRTAALMLASLKGYVSGPLACPNGGTRHSACTKALHTIAAALHSDEIETDQLKSEARRLNGLTVGMQAKESSLRGGAPNWSLLLASLSECHAKPDVTKWTSNSFTTGFTRIVQTSNPTKRQNLPTNANAASVRGLSETLNARKRS